MAPKFYTALPLQIITLSLACYKLWEHNQQVRCSVFLYNICSNNLLEDSSSAVEFLPGKSMLELHEELNN